jgi:hypothetical protein
MLGEDGRSMARNITCMSDCNLQVEQLKQYWKSKLNKVGLSNAIYGVDRSHL